MKCTVKYEKEGNYSDYVIPDTQCLKFCKEGHFPTQKALL